jgi:hypothetical protein
MNRHELINYLSKRCEIACQFADALDKAGFDIDYVMHIISGGGESAAAANVLLNLNKC